MNYEISREERLELLEEQLLIEEENWMKGYL